MEILERVSVGLAAGKQLSTVSFFQLLSRVVFTRFLLLPCAVAIITASLLLETSGSVCHRHTLQEGKLYLSPDIVWHDLVHLSGFDRLRLVQHMLCYNGIYFLVIFLMDR